jgi:hypothetical protein
MTFAELIFSLSLVRYSSFSSNYLVSPSQSIWFTTRHLLFIATTYVILKENHSERYHYLWENQTHHNVDIYIKDPFIYCVISWSYSPNSGHACHAGHTCHAGHSSTPCIACGSCRPGRTLSLPTWVEVELGCEIILLWYKCALKKTCIGTSINFEIKYADIGIGMIQILFPDNQYRYR